MLWKYQIRRKSFNPKAKKFKGIPKGMWEALNDETSYYVLLGLPMRPDDDGTPLSAESLANNQSLVPQILPPRN